MICSQECIPLIWELFTHKADFNVMFVLFLFLLLLLELFVIVSITAPSWFSVVLQVWVLRNSNNYKENTTS